MNAATRLNTNDDIIVQRIFQALCEQDHCTVTAQVNAFLATGDRAACAGRAALLLEHLTDEQFVATDMWNVETDERLRDFRSVAAIIGHRVRSLPEPALPAPAPPRAPGAMAPRTQVDHVETLGARWPSFDADEVREFEAMYAIERGAQPPRWERYRAEEEWLAGLARQEARVNQLAATGAGNAAAIQLAPGADEDALAMRRMREQLANNQVVPPAEEIAPPAVAGDGRQEPVSLRCSRSGAVFVRPILCNDGHVYEQAHVRRGERVVECHTMRSVVAAWQENIARGPEALAQALTDALKCPINLDTFVDPVTAADGHTYEAASIHAHLSSGGGGRSPLTNAPLPNHNLLRNLTLRALVAELADILPGGAGVGTAAAVDPVGGTALESFDIVLFEGLVHLIEGHLAGGAGLHFGSESNVTAAFRDLDQLERWRTGGIMSFVYNRRFRSVAARLREQAAQDLMATVGSVGPQPPEAPLPICAAFVYADILRMLGDTAESLRLFVDLYERVPDSINAPVAGRLGLLALASSPDDGLGNVRTMLLHGISAERLERPDQEDPHWLAAMAELNRREGELAAAQRYLSMLDSRRIVLLEARHTREKLRADQRRLSRG